VSCRRTCHSNSTRHDCYRQAVWSASKHA